MHPNAEVWIAWLLVIIAVFLGVLAAFLWSDWNHFARAGSFMVIVSLGLYFGPKRRALAERHAKNEEKLDALAGHITSASITDQQNREGSQVREAGEEMGRAYNELAVAHANIDLDSVERNHARHAVTIATIGTAIWGFGDLIGKLI